MRPSVEIRLAAMVNCAAASGLLLPRLCTESKLLINCSPFSKTMLGLLAQYVFFQDQFVFLAQQFAFTENRFSVISIRSLDAVPVLARTLRWRSTLRLDSCPAVETGWPASAPFPALDSLRRICMNYG